MGYGVALTFQQRRRMNVGPLVWRAEPVVEGSVSSQEGASGYEAGSWVAMAESSVAVGASRVVSVVGAMVVG